MRINSGNLGISDAPLESSAGSGDKKLPSEFAWKIGRKADSGANLYDTDKLTF
jgi:hypothetical protein